MIWEPTSGRDAWWSSLRIGHPLDVRDSVGKWCVCVIVEKQSTQIFVHYTGWGHKWDEWLSNDSERIAPLHSFSHADSPSNIKERENNKSPRLHIPREDAYITSNFAKSIRSMSKLADVHIEVQSSSDSLSDLTEDTFYLHYCILLSRCPALLEHLTLLPESREHPSIKVYSTRIPADILRVIIAYSYGGMLGLHDLQNHLLLNVLYFAEVLNLPNLFDIISPKLSSSNIMEALCCVDPHIQLSSESMLAKHIEFHLLSVVKQQLRCSFPKIPADTALGKLVSGILEEEKHSALVAEGETVVNEDRECKVYTRESDELCEKNKDLLWTESIHCFSRDMLNLYESRERRCTFYVMFEDEKFPVDTIVLCKLL